MYTWTEYERGWGQRPDGASLHVSEDVAKKYIKDYWDRQPKKVPDDYSKEDQSTPMKVKVSDQLFEQISKTGSLMLWQGEFNKLRTAEEILKVL
jgi:hypothetical protein